MNKDEVEYWKDFYKTYKNKNPSNFAIFINNYFKDNMKLLDAGCGNGRDSMYLSSKYQVVGIDKSAKLDDIKNCQFILSDFISYDKKNFDIIYSRFTFHSITDEDHQKFLESIYPGTYVCIETRSDKGLNEFRHHGNNHFRNLTNIDYLKDLLNKNNFDIEYIEENKGFAIYKDEDPTCIRVVCKKR